MCNNVSTGTMYRIPYLGTGHYWEKMWVCPKHFKGYYRERILTDYGVDITTLKEPITLERKSALELEKLHNC